MPYPAKTIAKAKLRYEQGETYVQISDDMGMHHKTVQEWGDKGEWVRGSLLPQISAKETESILETASRVGATKEFVIKKALELAKAENIAMPTGTGYATLPVYADSLKADGFMGIPKEDLVIVPDRKNQQEGNKLLADILKMREKGETTVIMPTPVMIMAEDGANIAVLGFNDGQKS